MENKKTLIRITTVPISLEKLLSGQLEYMSSHYNLIAVSSEKENLEKLGKKINLPVFFVNLTRQITPIKDLLALVKMYFFFKKTKPFIVHSHTPKAGTIGMLAAKLAGVPNRLHTVAGLPLLEIGGKKRKLLDFVEKLTYSCATKVYPNSLGLKDIIIENKYCKANKLKVI
ncbi:MAG TPA: glycosyltransferase, partial [Flavobacterium sp.]|nr:glycosyltransferase [Flavobacterium sp.]